MHGGDKADVIHIQAHPLVAHAIIQHGNYAKRFERLFDHLVRAAIEVQAAQTRCGEQRWRLGEGIFLLPVQGRGLGLHRIVGQLIQVLCHFRILGVELACMFERGVRAGRISAEPVLGRGLNQRRYGVAAGHVAGHAIVCIVGVELRRLFVLGKRRLELSIQIELACGQIEPGGLAAGCGGGLLVVFRCAGVGGRGGACLRALWRGRCVPSLGLHRRRKDSQQQRRCGRLANPHAGARMFALARTFIALHHDILAVSASRSASEVAQTSG